jgi:hypothetical protein
VSQSERRSPPAAHAHCCRSKQGHDVRAQTAAKRRPSPTKTLAYVVEHACVLHALTH